MAFQPVEVLRVYAFGRLVGAVAPSQQRGAFAFEYDPRWRRSGIELSPVLMPTTGRRVWVFPGLPEETFYGLPPLLADALPDRFGNAIINAALAREGVRPEQIGPLDRLAYLGDRGMGALKFVPTRNRPTDVPTSIELADLVQAARAAVHGDFSEDGRGDALNELLSVGSSAGGARAKAVIAWNRHTDEMRAGNLPVPDEFEQWLLKFDGVESTDKGRTFGEGREYGRVEYAYSLMARAAGIDMPETHLLEEGGRAHFMVRRFDRPANERRLHSATLCALDALDYNATGTNDYASLMVRADALVGDVETKREILRRVAFNVLAANNDDHTKNHTFLMQPTGQWSLSPAYDLTFAYDPHNKWLKQHLMSVGGKFAGITRKDLFAFGEGFDVPAARNIIFEVGDAIANWRGFASQAAISTSRADAIAERLDALAR